MILLSFVLSVGVAPEDGDSIPNCTAVGVDVDVGFGAEPEDIVSVAHISS